LQQQKKQETTMRFTVKHVHMSDEHKFYSTEFVNFVPGHAKEAGGQHDSLWIQRPDGERYELCGGIAYVMNEHGATVGKYHLYGANADQRKQEAA
jgi:hypothetical protein